jgi:hypothetical protein
MSVNKKKNNLIYLYIYYLYFYDKDFKNNIINKKTYNYILKTYHNMFLKYNYMFFYLLFELFKLNFIDLNNSNKYFRKYNYKKINNLFLKYKDNKLLIYMETYKNNLLIHNYKNKYFLKNIKINIFIYKDFIFKIELIFYLIYRDYIEYIKRYKYNEYLDENPITLKYPLLKVLLRKVDQDLLNIIKKKEKEFIKTRDIINNFDLYYLKIKKNNKKYLYIFHEKYINIFFKNEKIIKI